jgi:hypothetical protein
MEPVMMKVMTMLIRVMMMMMMARMAMTANNDQCAGDNRNYRALSLKGVTPE